MAWISRSTRLILFGVAIAAAPQLASAQNYPSKPVKLVLPYAPGGIIDYVGRHLAEHLGENLGQTVIAENKPGAGGMVGADVVARSAPDGYTIVLTDPGIVINPTLQNDVPYDLFKGLQPISIIGSSASVVVVSPKLPVKTFQELIAYGKANPGKLNFATAGIGTAPHLAGEMVKLRTGIEMTHVPYRGIGPAFPDIMNGKVQLAFSSIAGALPFTNDKRVTPIATTLLKRSSVYPDVPTIAESGLPGFEVDLWVGIYGPAHLPPDVLKRLNTELNKTLQNPQFRAALAKVGIEPRGTSVEETVAITRSEYDKWKKVIVDGKLKEKAHAG
jgi:tripartite-type tricarboxylate transporter receptor subunit TctC